MNYERGVFMSYIMRTTNVTKVYGDTEVVSNVSMNIKKGEIYGFLGPNGAGKTTLMKMIVNLVKPTAGEIEIFGEKITEKSYEILKRMGSIIESPVFYDNLTGRKNLELHCEYMGYYKKDAIEEALKLVELTGIDKKSVKEYSLGMKQRLGIARAIVTKPELLILDEPINGLDPVGIKKIRNLLSMLSKEYGITILISSHILAEIEYIADTIGVINNGKLLEEVSIAETKEIHTEFIELIVNDVKKASFIIDNELKVKNFKVLEDNKIRIYDMSISQSQVSKALILKGIEVEEITKKSGTLEGFFISIINGGEKSA